MFCPQCGTEVGAEARACATCGWTASRKKLWIILGSVFGGLGLLCCGGAAFVGVQTKKWAEESVPPMHILICKVQVVNWAKNHGGVLPETLAEALAEKVRAKDGREVDVDFGGGDTSDLWGTGIRYTRNPDGSFEVRSAGRDRTFDNADDLVERGRADEDLEALKKALEERVEAQVHKLANRFGVKVKVRGGDLERGKDEAPADPPPAGGK